MNTHLSPITYAVTFSVNSFRSFPAEIGSSAPVNPTTPSRRIEFPQEQSLTAPELDYSPVDSAYEPIPAPTHLPTAHAEQVEE